MAVLGLAYSFGDGVTKNQDYASRWIRAAADRGLVSAQYSDCGRMDKLMGKNYLDSGEN